MLQKQLTKYQQIEKVLKECQQPNYRMKQILHCIFKEKKTDFNEMSVLPKNLRDTLTTEIGTSLLTVEPLIEQKSQQVRKVLFNLSGDNRIETVNMTYQAGWESFCISSQCGCNLGCQFCATGKIGLRKNLTAEEITDQVLYFLLKGHQIDSISFMGMGEPLANPHFFEALDIFMNPDMFQLSPRRLSVSTIGVIPKIKRLTAEYPQVHLTFSLHSPFDEERSQLMPINKSFPLLKVMDTLDEHIKVTSKKVYIAYILLPDVNDSLTHAVALADLLRSRYKKGKLYHVNLIRYNPTFDAPRTFKQVDEKQVKLFYQTLISKGINVTIRSQFGIEIDAACGQLYGNYEIKNKKTIQVND
ncbi:23S rRNA (adenine(2503)-C(8))-methyltransferase Cfr(D) [Enterococcus asini]|uniref:23S rRNA (Adenine(2058)-N(6))-dimethyltransferase Erm(A) n=9 Tax=Lactobacillales TaxID=186826 RepID=A0A8G0RKL8_9STRE|nr:MULTISPECIES: 23S rRNA (adenine(2503)-C(8))-methyltransferase Cfr(D) [Lactobacillales]HAC5320489.1 Cfr family 23S rRNA (adenine(2503)-C(8))-methyltransferase [Listeria monocytogenes]AXY65402.1 rRNA methyltransferase [Enterococcus faecium]EKQ3346683.1 23S rRNA (adenine(2503)-C(8))-methyltransferase Cfr(D) [Enterococcus faecium]EKQ3346827.1 23S rRNA (adenine(2503)-C(8))-methyltransferase Cfr(D) [Enterococcus faecium]EKQ3704542.1 23S rRNA (adenine(2503)-C(8))-methyltransferase Cfr(D) [Enteroco